MSRAAFEDALCAELAAARIAYTDEQIAQCGAYYALLLEWNERMNLTTVTAPLDAARLHFVDSLMVLHFVPREDFDGASLIDVGTGAGFPGIPLKIFCPTLHVTLLDAQQKRLTFLEEVVTTLGLRDEGSVTLLHARAEDAASKGRHRQGALERSSLRETFHFATARAVANLSTLSEYCLPFVEKGGLFFAYKTEDVQAEADAAAKALRTLGGTLRAAKVYTLPATEIGRGLALIDKVASTPAGYPRKAGTPAKSPL